jgi:hypothetical protein
MSQHGHVDGGRVADEEREAGEAGLTRAGEEPDAHPVATGAGAMGGADVGAAAGAAIGPAGAAAGAALGAVTGGPAGRAVAQTLNPAGEDAYWREHYLSRPYTDDTLSYDYYRPAYRYGWEARARLVGRRWDEVERDLERGWRENRGVSHLGWSDARLAARDAWQRVDNQLLDERERRRLDDEENGFHGVAGQEPR